MARTGHNATFSATSAHSRALGTGCVWLGRPSVRASHRRRHATRTRPTAQRCPPAGATTANETLPASSWFCRPNSNPAKICAFPPPSAGTHATFCTSGVVVPGCVCGAPVARGSRAAPTPTRRLPQLLGRGRPRRLRTSGPLHQLRSAPLSSAPHDRHPPPQAPLLRRAQGRARRGRGTAVTPPVPCLQESRVRLGHVLAPQPIAENAVQEQGGCGERPTKTGDVFKPGPGGIRGCCSGDGDTGSGGHPEVLVQGVNPSEPAEPRVRAGQGGVATRGEEGGRGFESVPGTREETLSPQSGSPSPPGSQVGGCACASRAQPCATRRPARPSPARGAAVRPVTGRWWPPRPAS